MTEAALCGATVGGVGGSGHRIRNNGGLVALVVLALLGAACGDDGGSDGVEASDTSDPVDVADLADGATVDDGAPHPTEVERLAVVAAHEAAMDARISSAAAPPDPESEEVQVTHVDPLLGEWQDRLGGMAAQGLAIRYPEDSQLEILAVTDVTFSWSDGSAAADGGDEGEVGDTATLTACIIDDGETYNVSTGEVTAGGALVTVHEQATLRKVDGEWRLSDRVATEREGRTGCAADSAGDEGSSVEVEAEVEGEGEPGVEDDAGAAGDDGAGAGGGVAGDNELDAVEDAGAGEGGGVVGDDELEGGG